MKGYGMGETEVVKVQFTDSLNISIPGCLTYFAFQRMGMTPGKAMLLLLVMPLAPKPRGIVVVAPRLPPALLTWQVLLSRMLMPSWVYKQRKSKKSAGDFPPSSRWCLILWPYHSSAKNSPARKSTSSYETNHAQEKKSWSMRGYISMPRISQPRGIVFVSLFLFFWVGGQVLIAQKQRPSLLILPQENKIPGADLLN